MVRHMGKNSSIFSKDMNSKESIDAAKLKPYTLLKQFTRILNRTKETSNQAQNK